MASAAERPRVIAPAQLLAVVAYTGLGGLLLVTRLVGLDRSYASDELMTVVNYVRAGPHEILTGAYIPNNHELFSLLGWATWQVTGESAVALRLWSVIPFLAGVVLVTAWLHVRVGALSGILFLSFCTLSPLLLDITRQARGYGLAFLAMAVTIVAALEAERTGRTSLVAAVCAAGVVGTWTLPHFAVAFLATAVTLMTRRELRRATTVLLGPSLLAIALWYAPHLEDVARGSQQEYGAPIQPGWVLTAPIDQALLPALNRLDEMLLYPDLSSLVFTLVLALVIGSSPLLRRRGPALVLGAGLVATILLAWSTRVGIAPRFLSYFLVPLFVLLATGSAAIVTRFVSTGRPVVRTLAVVTIVGLVGLGFAEHVGPISRLPREAQREAAMAVRSTTSPTTPVVTNMPYPRDFEHYLGREVVRVHTAGDARRWCAGRREIAVVTQPWIIEPVVFPCTARKGARHDRFEQYGRGREINVWVVPPEQ